MNTYRAVPGGAEFEVGHYVRHYERAGSVEAAQDEWVSIRTFKHDTEAARFVNYLNGGSGLPFSGY